MILYTDISPDCCPWIKTLISDNLIPPGTAICKSTPASTPAKE